MTRLDSLRRGVLMDRQTACWIMPDIPGAAAPRSSSVWKEREIVIRMTTVLVRWCAAPIIAALRSRALMIAARRRRSKVLFDWLTVLILIG